MEPREREEGMREKREETKQIWGQESGQCEKPINKQCVLCDLCVAVATQMHTRDNIL